LEEDEILEESGEFQNGSCEKNFELRHPMYKAKPITGEEQQQ